MRKLKTFMAAYARLRSHAMESRKNNAYMQFLIEKIGFEGYEKKDIRVLFSLKDGTILDLIVDEFKNPTEKMHLYRAYSYDFGNCLCDWEEWSLSDILIKIFVSYLVPPSIRIKIMLELAKVKEWQDDLSIWIYKNCGGE